MPLLRPFLGPGRPFNFLIRNKWRSGQQMHKLRQLPVLLLSSLQVSCCTHLAAFRFEQPEVLLHLCGQQVSKHCTCPKCRLPCRSASTGTAPSGLAGELNGRMCPLAG